MLTLLMGLLELLMGLLELVGSAVGPTEGSVGSIGAAKIDGDTGSSCAAVRSIGVAAATSFSIPRASREGKGEDMAPLGSEGSLEAELHLKRT